MSLGSILLKVYQSIEYTIFADQDPIIDKLIRASNLDYEAKVNAYVEIVAELWKHENKDIDRLHHVLEQMPECWRRQSFLFNLALEVAKTDILKADTIAKNLGTNSVEKANYHQAITKIHVNQSDFSSALESAIKINTIYTYQLEEALISIIPLAKNREGYQTIVEYTKKTKSFYLLSSILPKIIKILVEAKEYETALEIAMNIPDNSTDAYCLKARKVSFRKIFKNRMIDVLDINKIDETVQPIIDSANALKHIDQSAAYSGISKGLLHKETYILSLKIAKEIQVLAIKENTLLSHCVWLTNNKMFDEAKCRAEEIRRYDQYNQTCNKDAAYWIISNGYFNEYIKDFINKELFDQANEFAKKIPNSICRDNAYVQMIEKLIKAKKLIEAHSLLDRSTLTGYAYENLRKLIQEAEKSPLI